MPVTQSNVFVYNQDIVGLYDRINRFIEELMKSVSSGLSLTNSFDQARLAVYLNAIDRYHDWVKSQPHLDLPETAPQPFVLEASPVVPNVENESINDVIRLLVAARDELIHSQSARLPAQMLVFDSTRLTAIIEKTRRLLEDYIAVTDPLDLPESSPREVVSGSGRTGV